MVAKLAEESLQTKYGTFKEVLYYDGQRESIALVMGNVSGGENILCRMHSSCLHGHVFNSIECVCREQMEMTQQMIQDAGTGIIIWLEEEGKGNGHLALMKSKVYKRAGMLQGAAYEAAGYQKDARDYTVAAKILLDLGVKSVRLVTDNPEKANALTNKGIKVTGIQSLIPWLVHPL